MPNPAWTPIAPTAAQTVIVDPNGNVQQCSVAGVTGPTLPAFGQSLATTTGDGTVVWICVAVLAGVALPAELVGLPPPIFVNDADGLDPQKILDDMVASFEALTDRTLYPAQLEQLLINLYAFREALVRNIIQYAGQQSLLAFANFPNIDYLGALLGVTRLLPAGALTTLRFTLTGGALNQPYLRPAGTLVGTQDGAVQFATQTDLVIPAGATTGSVGAVCTTPGTIGNGYGPGQVSVLLTPDALVSATNTTMTADGAPIESTEKLRARIQQAPNRFSTAGPAAAYRFYALSVDPTVADVGVTSPAPGRVAVAVLGPVSAQPAAPGSQGIVSGPLLAAIAAALSAETIRPLCDTVNVAAAAEIDYQVAGTVTLQPNADPTTIEAALAATARSFAVRTASKLQSDIVPEEWIAILGSLGGIYRVQLTDPAYGRLAAGQWANCTAVTLAIVDVDNNPVGTITL